MTVDATRSRWSLRPGRSIRRSELHDRVGGNRRSRISPSRSTPNVLVFLARGDDLLQWEDGVLHCATESRGTELATPTNRAVVEHRKAGRALRVFWGTAGEVEYMGKFELDQREPFYVVQPPASDGDSPRRVLVFRLVPVGHFNLPSDLAANGLAGAAATNDTVVSAPSRAQARAGDRARALVAGVRRSPYSIEDAAWPLVLVGSSLAVAITTFVWTASPFRPLVTTWFLIACPGLALIRLLPRRGIVTLLVLAVAASLSLETLVAEAMLKTRAWSPGGTLAVLIAITLAGSALQLRRFLEPLVGRPLHASAAASAEGM